MIRSSVVKYYKNFWSKTMESELKYVGITILLVCALILLIATGTIIYVYDVLMYLPKLLYARKTGKRPPEHPRFLPPGMGIIE
jgi:hypothetical protein